MNENRRDIAFEAYFGTRSIDARDYQRRDQSKSCDFTRHFLNHTEQFSGFEAPKPIHSLILPDPHAFFSWTQKRLPLPMSDSKPTVPPMRSAAFLTMARPMPVPSYFFSG